MLKYAPVKLLGIKAPATNRVRLWRVTGLSKSAQVSEDRKCAPRSANHRS